MPCCKRTEDYLQTKPRSYPCKFKKEQEPCAYMRIEAFQGLAEQKMEEKEEENTEKKEIKREPPCDKSKPKKKVLEMGFKQICSKTFMRKWNLEESPVGSNEKFPKWFKRRRESPKRLNVCPRELDDYEKRLYTPICKPKPKPIECRVPFDQGICVFCSGSLYTGGYLHELFEKVPLVKKQSENYGDDVGSRIGVRTRIIVHRKCYNSYIDTFTKKTGEDEEEVDMYLESDEAVDSEDLNCDADGEEEEEQQEDGVLKEGKQKEGGGIKAEDETVKQSKKATGEIEKRRKQHFCLTKFRLPEIHSVFLSTLTSPHHPNTGDGLLPREPRHPYLGDALRFGVRTVDFGPQEKISRIGAKVLGPSVNRFLHNNRTPIKTPKRIYLKSDVNAVHMGRFKPHGLVADLWPNIRLLQLSGHFLHEYHDDNSVMNVLMRKIYSSFHLGLILLHYAAIIANLAMEADDVNVLAANSITVLFFTHCITKFCYFALRRQKFYRTLAVWDTQNSHPLFAESHARHRAVAITKSRRLLMITVIGTLLTVVGWTGSTFFGESTMMIPDPENNNETIKVEIPRLMLRAWYPWDASSGSNYMFSFVYQLYWLVFTLFHANLVDLLFCSWLIFACEQLLHVKEIMKPLIDLSSSLDTYNPGSADLFKAAGANSDIAENFYDSKDERQINIRSIYSNMRDFGLNRNTGAMNAVNGIGPNGLSKKHEMLVRSAIKYWVERHKHIVRYVGSIGDAYGLALLLHMLTSTITLTLLAYQATKIDGMDLYAMAVLGYLFYSLAQVFAFCIYGNQLIEESSSVMEAAYSCQWYDGSEEAKTFVQIVCQQCQKALSISGAKFFTVSLDLFASVLGAVVTYFMVLVQLK